MKHLIAAIAALAMTGAAASADEISDTIRAALEAYESGDVAGAKDDLDYAVQLLAQAKAGGLADFLPEPMEGWTRELSDVQAGGPAMFGGGISAAAAYSGPEGTVEVNLLADSPMVASMAAMFGSAATMGAMGRVKRVNRVSFAIGADGDIKGMVGGKVLVQVGGSAPEEVKLAHLEAMDFNALSNF